MFGNEIFKTVSNKKHNSDLPIVAVTQDKGVALRDDIDYKISVSEKSVSTYKIVEKGDFVISLRSFQGGIEYSDVTGICSPAYTILKPIHPIVDKFYKFYLKQDRYISKLNERLEGIRDGKNISFENFSIIPLPYPALDEQNKIANFLSLLDERIETQNKIIEELETLIKGLNNFIFENLKNEKLISFSKLYDKAGEGGTPDTKISDYYENGKIPFVKIDDLKNKYLKKVDCFITEKGLKKSSAWLVPTHSIIFSNGATIGSISINKFPVATKQGILGIVLKKNISLEYIYYFITSQYFMREICKITTHGTMKTAYLKDIDKIQCFVPNHKRQTDIVEVLSSLTLKIELERSVLDKLKFQKQYLLRHMFI